MKNLRERPSAWSSLECERQRAYIGLGVTAQKEFWISLRCATSSRCTSMRWSGPPCTTAPWLGPCCIHLCEARSSPPPNGVQPSSSRPMCAWTLTTTNIAGSWPGRPCSPRWVLLWKVRRLDRRTDRRRPWGRGVCNFTHMPAECSWNGLVLWP